ncbi:MAG: amidohydrolase family protein, partial [Alphaproteobacteria bacterium]|nr:amidohydrolase family protein [Alphaproteobacteria bacterium]
MTQNLSIRAPDDWHVHLRDGDILRAVAPFTARQFARAIIMPNLAPPVTCVANAQAYHARVMACIPEGMSFTPLMTCYLTDRSDPNDLVTGYERGVYTAAKLYPAHATTNAAAGVSDVNNISAALERMQAIGMPLLVHGEVTDRDVDIFDREAVFIERVLAPLMQHFPALKIVLEHITTRQAVEFVESAPATLAATIT